MPFTLKQEIKTMAGINNADLNDRLPQRFSVDSDTFHRSALGDIDPDRNFLNEFTSCSNTYYDETEFNNKFRNSGNLSLLHLNINIRNDRNVANFNTALINTSWDFIYNNADMQSLYTSFQRVIDHILKWNLLHILKWNLLPQITKIVTHG